MEITVIGCGYVGLVTAACLAGFGHTVTGVEKDPAKVSALKEGKIPFYEEDLAPLVADGLQNKRLFSRKESMRVLAGRKWSLLPWAPRPSQTARPTCAKYSGLRRRSPLILKNTR